MSEAPLSEVTLTIWFCKDKDVERCERYPRTSRYFGRATFVVNLNEYDDISEIVEYVMDELESRFKRSLGNIPGRDDVAARWRDKIYPYIYNVVFDVIVRYLDRLYDLWRTCTEGLYFDREALMEPIETTYPRLFAEVEPEWEEMDCKNAEYALAILNRYREAREVTGMAPLAFVNYKMSRLDEARRKVIEPLLAGDAPLETIVRRIPGAKWCYEVYYHE